MLFNSPVFALFLPVMLAVYWSLHGRARRAALLIGSYFFYAWWDWRFLSLLLISTMVDYSCGRAMGRRAEETDQAKGGHGRRRFLILSIVTNLGILGTFKYFDFFRDSAVTLLGGLGIDASVPTLNLILPMGISFYTFQTMSYTIDVYRGEKPERSLLSFAIFVACFPQLVAGPIMRARNFLPQIKGKQRLTGGDFSLGTFLIFRGLFKKMIVADMLGLYVDEVFRNPAGYAGISCWVSLYAYAFQIYMDFSGYTDVAIGVGRLLGLKLTENFNRPYLAVSPADFWRRWHITLSTWLRDYLYIPLGGSRVGKWLTTRNLFITMALGGLWHGAAWTFVAWGVYHGVLLVIQRLLGRRDPAAVNAQPLPIRILKIAGMFHLTCIGWLLFRAPDWATVHLMASRLIDFSPGEIQGKRAAIVVALCMLAHLLPQMRTLGEQFKKLPALGQGVAAGLCLWALLLLAPGVKPFVYFQF
jgi:alginate O-acetyltransferase complex protein AlgI